MILVDTSVWIGYLRGDFSPVTDALDRLMADGVPFGITGIILQEILQGADSPESQQRLKSYFVTQRFLHPLDPVETHAQAADIYARCRRAGLTIRSTIDCLIARIAIEHKATLLHADRDYLHMARVIPELQLVEA